MRCRCSVFTGKKDTEHLFNHMMTERYFVEKLDPNEHTTNVYFALGPAANKLLNATLENIPRGVVQHTFINRKIVKPTPTPKAKKPESGKGGVGRGKRKRAGAELSSGEAGLVQNERAASESDTAEVERAVLDLTGYEGEMEVDEEEDKDISYGWSRSMLSKPPVKRRRQCRRQISEVPDSESERERERGSIFVSSD